MQIFRNKTDLLNAIIQAGDEGFKDEIPHNTKEAGRFRNQIHDLREMGFRINCIKKKGWLDLLL